MSEVGRVAKALRAVRSSLPGGGEARPGQVAMAEAVAGAFGSGTHLLAQAGTGTGKSLAYLVPAALSERTTVVTTATKALQDQLANKDLPLVARALGRELRYAVLKGRANYLCRQRAAEITAEPEQLSFESDGLFASSPLAREVRRLLDWAEMSTTGDRAELDFEPSPRAWGLLSVTATECPGASRCPSGAVCFAESARRAAARADVLVVNTHLYGAHLASGGTVLPEHDQVVFDEAHEIEDVMSDALGVHLGPQRLRALARALRAALKQDGTDAADALDAAAVAMEETLVPLLGRRVRAGLEGVEHILNLAAQRVRGATALLREGPEEQGAGDVGPEGDEDPPRSRALLAAGHLAADLAAVADLDDDHVAWVAGVPGATSLEVAPVDVAPLLSQALWGAVTAVLTSATIPPGLGARIGLPEGTREIDVGSPFPYRSNALLYCAKHLPDRRDPGFDAALHDELEALIEAAGGRTLALFTSWRAMREAANALRERVAFRILTQDELPKPALLAAFAAQESACLFATMGFWQGVDVPGPTLSLVTIDKLPFPRPDDPLVSARRERAGSAAFRVVDLPYAATRLAQGAGRLIRSAEDRGVVAVLDRRLALAGYRWDLVRALPPMARTSERAQVARFLAEITTPGAEASRAGAASPAPP